MPTIAPPLLSVLNNDPQAPGSTTCDPGLALDPWTIDALPSTYGPGASALDHIAPNAPRQGILPAEYRNSTPEELDLRIRASKAALGDRVVILGHFYQRDEIVKHADFLGDSFQLANAAMTRPNAEAIVFCGVHFMAETADMLSRPDQAVILPNLAAGCSMADMADLESVEAAWEDLADALGFDSVDDLDKPQPTNIEGAPFMAQDVLGTGFVSSGPGFSRAVSSPQTARLQPLGENVAPGTSSMPQTGGEAQAGRQPIIPVTYMNSSAALKGFCGRHGGIVCTSSNAATVLKWAFERGQRVLFFPDQHLGRNTAKSMGIPLDQMPLWNPRKPLGGNTPQQLQDAKVILWHGFCSVHKRFTVDQITQARAQHPNVRVIVHPECPMDVVDAADESGSTDYIKKAVIAAPPGATLAIGTEINLVQRLAADHADKTIFCLDPVICPCSTMYRIHPGYLAWVLESLERGQTPNRITVPESVAAPARIALQRMLAAKPAPIQPQP